jgi:hypothetical protein
MPGNSLENIHSLVNRAPKVVRYCDYTRSLSSNRRQRQFHDKHISTTYRCRKGIFKGFRPNL